MNKFETMTGYDSCLVRRLRYDARMQVRDFIADRAVYMRRERFGRNGTPDLATLDIRCQKRAVARFRAETKQPLCCLW